MNNKLHIKKTSVEYIDVKSLQAGFRYHCDYNGLKNVSIHFISETPIFSLYQTWYKFTLFDDSSGEVTFEIHLPYVPNRDLKVKRNRGAILGRYLVDYLRTNLSKYLDYE